MTNPAEFSLGIDGRQRWPQATLSPVMETETDFDTRPRFKATLDRSNEGIPLWITLKIGQDVPYTVRSLAKLYLNPYLPAHSSFP